MRSDKVYNNNADRQREYRLRAKIKGKKTSGQHKTPRLYRPKPKVTLPFVGWDGEGRDVNGKHCYTLLHNSRGEYIYDSSGLSTIECLRFLLRNSNDGSNEKSIHVGFAFGYDVNMILADLPEYLLRQLNGQYFNTKTEQWEKSNKEECKWFDENEKRWYFLSYRPRKFFRVSRSRGPQATVQKTRRDGSVYYKRDVELSINMWDVFGFFQCSFIKALNEYWPDKEDIPGYDTIVCQKENRGAFTEETDEDVRYYCELECEYLARTMEKLRGYLLECEIKNSSWDGTGAVARYVLQQARVRDYMAPTPEHLKDPVSRAYSGGRIETTCIGREEGTFYDYDLNSAYPSVQCALPCLAHSQFSFGGTSPQGISLVRVRWRFTALGRHTFYPLFFRNFNGEIKYPSQGQGWFWQDEYLAALAFLKHSKVTLGHRNEYVKIVECYNLKTSCDHKPFDFLRNQYEQRKAMKAAGNAAQLAMKLSINSCYGKVMQQVGGIEGKPPPFFQLEWGGMITSAVRAKLVMAALTTIPENIIYFATDGILSKAPLQVPLGKEMNTWEIKNAYDEAVVVLPGVYWLRKNNDWFTATRGYEDVTGGRPVHILDAWEHGMRTMRMVQTRFITLRHSLVGHALSEQWRTWDESFRDLNIVGRSAKRHELPLGFDSRNLLSRLYLLDSSGGMTEDGISSPYGINYWATEGGYERSIDENDYETESG